MRITSSLSLLLLCLFSLLSLLPSEVRAFDGDRKGFTVGFGLGATPVANWTASNGNINETESGLAFNLLVGHGFSLKDLVVWSIVGASYTLDSFADVQVTQGINGVQWYHFLSNRERSF